MSIRTDDIDKKGLFNGNALSQISWLVNISAKKVRNMVSEKLERDNGEERFKFVEGFGNENVGICPVDHLVIFRVGDEKNLSPAGDDLLAKGDEGLNDVT